MQVGQHSPASLELQSQANAKVKAGGTLDLEASAAGSLKVGGSLAVQGASVSLNGAGGCPFAARMGDLVNASMILTGSTSVCIGN